MLAPGNSNCIWGHTINLNKYLYNDFLNKEMIYSIVHYFCIFCSISLVQFSSVAQSCLTLCNPADCSTPGLPVHHNSQSPPKPMSIELVMPSNHLILCHPLLLLPSILPSIRVFSNESALCIRWPKIWSFSFNISPSSEHPGLTFFRMDWLDLLAVQGTLKNLLQHHSSKASILRCYINMIPNFWYKKLVFFYFIFKLYKLY